ncbi:hypothetical protein D3C81_1891590 [compost metagenome]
MLTSATTPAGETMVSTILPSMALAIDWPKAASGLSLPAVAAMLRAMLASSCVLTLARR